MLSSESDFRGPHMAVNESADTSPNENLPTSSSSGGAAGILDIPDDLLSRIFSNFEPAPELCLLMEVCTKFAKAASAAELWRQVKAVDPITRRAKKHGHHNAYTSIVYGLDDSVNPPKQATASPNSGRRYRKGAGLAVDVITSRGGSQLVSLDLNDCFPNFPRFDHLMTDDDIKVISDRCSESLQILRLSSSKFVTDSALVDLARSCTRLRTLQMSDFPNMTVRLLGDIVAACPTLEDISVSRCSQFDAEYIDKELDPVRDTLKRLDISDTGSDSIDMFPFMTKFPALEEINASNCKELFARGRNEDFPDMSVASSIVSLKFDKIRSMHQDVLIQIWEKCRELRHFSLNNNQHFIEENELRPLLNLHMWPPLKTLRMAGHYVTDELWQCIFERLGASLVVCDLSQNKNLTCRLQLFRNDSFAELKDLRIRSTGATEETVKTLISISPKLEILDLSGCPGVDRELRRNPLGCRNSEHSTQSSRTG